MVKAMLVATLGVGALVAGCGGDADRASTTPSTAGTATTAVPTTTARAAGNGPIPRALRAAESDAEDGRASNTASSPERAAERASGAARRSVTATRTDTVPLVAELEPTTQKSLDVTGHRRASAGAGPRPRVPMLAADTR